MLPYFIPFGVALAVAGAIRLAAGPERGARYAGLSFLVGFAAAWNWLLLAPWVPFDALSRTIHIAIGGTVLGLIFDSFDLRRSWLVWLTLAFILGSVWATVTGALLGAPPETVGGWLRFVIYLVVWSALFKRLDGRKQEGPTALIMVLMLSLGLGLVAQMSGEGAAGATAYALAAALAGLLVLTWILSLRVGAVAILGGGGAALGIAMALVGPTSQASVISVVFLILVLYADGTAKRLPLGPEALRPALYPVALILVSVLPVALAGVLAFVLTGA